MVSRLAVLFLVILSAAGPSFAAIPPGMQSVSANEQYAIELSRTPDNKILVSVFNVSKEVKTLHWSRQIEWEEPHPFFNSPGMIEIKAHVTNDGTTVVLRDYNAPQEKNGVRIIRRAQEDQKTVRPFERRNLTGVTPPKSFPPEERYNTGMRRNTAYMHLTALFDFIFDEENSYALWFGQTDQWLLISLADGKEILVQDPKMLVRLNSLAREKAQELVLQHQPPPLRKMLAALKASVAKLVPTLQTPFYRPYMVGETAAAYLFLTARRNVADKTFVEGLVQFPPEGIQDGHLIGQDRFDISCSVTRSERLIGDLLLSRWNGNTNREAIPRETYLLVPHDVFEHLGTIKLDFKLPMPLPRTNVGNFWAYLVPANVPSDKWHKSDQVISFRTFLEHPGAPHSTPPGTEGTLNLRAITPGEYRVKMIWERYPTARMWRTNAYIAIPGDYESVESTIIKVGPGEINKITLSCTNRVGGAEAYAADDQWVKEQTSR
jgi:hypothetical protein